jgi:hypothetical protein
MYPKSAGRRVRYRPRNGHKDIRVGDVIESFTTETLAAELGQNSAAATADNSVNA